MTTIQPGGRIGARADLTTTATLTLPGAHAGCGRGGGRAGQRDQSDDPGDRGGRAERWRIQPRRDSRRGAAGRGHVSADRVQHGARWRWVWRAWSWASCRTARAASSVTTRWRRRSTSSSRTRVEGSSGSARRPMESGMSPPRPTGAAQPAATPAVFQAFDAAYFDDSATNFMVRLAEPVLASALTVSNAVQDYSLSGFAVGGPAGLVKRGRRPPDAEQRECLRRSQRGGGGHAGDHRRAQPGARFRPRSAPGSCAWPVAARWRCSANTMLSREPRHPTGRGGRRRSRWPRRRR
jgi:hypothetical protein